jgi:hypothetical protein
MANVDTVDITKLIMVEQGSTPSNPSAGKQKLFVRTSDHVLCLVDSSGTVTAFGSPSLTNPMTTVGDLIRGGTAGAPTALAASSTAGQFLKNGGTATAPSWASRELDYVEFTSPVNITATSEATSNTIVTSSSVAYDGSTAIVIEYFCPRTRVPAGNHDVNYTLWDSSTDIGLLGLLEGPDGTNELRVPTFLSRRITPSNASHTYSIRAYVDAGTGHADAGAGGSSATIMPGFIRITRAL